MRQVFQVVGEAQTVTDGDRLQPPGNGVCIAVRLYVGAVNDAWQEEFTDFDQIAPQLPEKYCTRRGRLDMTEWYTRSMTQWCDFWAKAARAAMPNTRIYQSAGGWGYREAGTDFTALSESMRDHAGGIRLTNETDSFAQNYYATRLAATAARPNSLYRALY